MHKHQHTLWLLAAMAAPLAHFSGSGWLSALLAALAVLPLALIPKNWEDIPKPVALIQLLWLGAVAGGFLSGSAAYWPSDNDLAVPLTLLVLAVLTDSAAAPRIGAVAAFCMVLLAIPAAVSGAARVEPEWLSPVAGEWPWGLTLALLLPNLPMGRGEKKRILYPGVLAVALSALVQGTISPQVAASVPDPFYQTARALGHMEPVIAVGVTLGWYTLAAYLMESGRVIAAESGMNGRWGKAVMAATAVITLIFRGEITGMTGAAVSVILWLAVPLLNPKRKMKKDEKRC